MFGDPIAVRGTPRTAVASNDRRSKQTITAYNGTTSAGRRSTGPNKQHGTPSAGVEASKDKPNAWRSNVPNPLLRSSPARGVACQAVVAETGAGATAVASPERVKAKFVVPKHEVRFGQMFKIVGSVPELGNWNPEKALVMNWSEGHNWSADTELPLGTVTFKIVKTEAAAADWEAGDNRSLELSVGHSMLGPDGHARIVCVWGTTTNTTVKYKPDKAFLKEQLRLAEAKVKDLNGQREALKQRMDSLSTMVQKYDERMQDMEQKVVSAMKPSEEGGQQAARYTSPTRPRLNIGGATPPAAPAVAAPPPPPVPAQRYSSPSRYASPSRNNGNAPAPAQPARPASPFGNPDGGSSNGLAGFAKSSVSAFAERSASPDPRGKSPSGRPFKAVQNGYEPGRSASPGSNGIAPAPASANGVHSPDGAAAASAAAATAPPAVPAPAAAPAKEEEEEGGRFTRFFRKPEEADARKEPVPEPAPAAAADVDQEVAARFGGWKLRKTEQAKPAAQASALAPAPVSEAAESDAPAGAQDPLDNRFNNYIKRSPSRGRADPRPAAQEDAAVDATQEDKEDVDGTPRFSKYLGAGRGGRFGGGVRAMSVLVEEEEAWTASAAGLPDTPVELDNRPAKARKNRRNLRQRRAARAAAAAVRAEAVTVAAAAVAGAAPAAGTVSPMDSEPITAPTPSPLILSYDVNIQGYMSMSESDEEDALAAQAASKAATAIPKSRFDTLLDRVSGVPVKEEEEPVAPATPPASVPAVANLEAAMLLSSGSEMVEVSGDVEPSLLDVAPLLQVVDARPKASAAVEVPFLAVETPFSAAVELAEDELVVEVPDMYAPLSAAVEVPMIEAPQAAAVEAPVVPVQVPFVDEEFVDPAVALANTPAALSAAERNRARAAAARLARAERRARGRERSRNPVVVLPEIYYAADTAEEKAAAEVPAVLAEAPAVNAAFTVAADAASAAAAAAIVIAPLAAAAAEVPAVIAEVPAIVAEVPADIAAVPAVIAEVPAIVAEELAIVAEEPAIIAELPAIVAEEPAIIAEEPAVITEVPAVIAEVPAFIAEVPAVVAEEPAVIAEEPAVVAEEPAVIAEEPAVIAEVPAIIAEVAAVVAEEPAVIAEEPAIIAEVPAVIAEVAAVVAEEPAVIAELPAIVAEEPANVAEEPAIVAEEPAIVAEAVVSDASSVSDAEVPVVQWPATEVLVQEVASVADPVAHSAPLVMEVVRKLEVEPMYAVSAATAAPVVVPSKASKELVGTSAGVPFVTTAAPAEAQAPRSVSATPVTAQADADLDLDLLLRSTSRLVGFVAAQLSADLDARMARSRAVRSTDILTRTADAVDELKSRANAVALHKSAPARRESTPAVAMFWAVTQAARPGLAVWDLLRSGLKQEQRAGADAVGVALAVAAFAAYLN